MTSKKSTKIAIPHTSVNAEGISIVGVLEQLEPERPTRGRKIALILHGTMGHKDYLFQKRLALRLPLDSFRFDFRGNHETGGTWKQGAIAEDVEDLVVVVKYLTTELGYEVDLLVGHSRGSVVALHWLCTSAEGQRVGGMVNVSGRYRMHRIYDGARAYQSDFEAKGFYEWNIVVARKAIAARIYPKDLETFSSWDTSIVWDSFPQNTDVLSVHGLADKIVPPFDATIYARALGNRTAGTHSLHYMEDADHNFTGRQDEVADAILEWWGMHERRALQTGVWQTGLRGKL